MWTISDCLSCLVKQAAATAELSSGDPETVQKVIQEVRRLINRFDHSLSPPENAMAMYALIAEITGVGDPYRKIRKQSNSMALLLKDDILPRIKSNDNPFLAAVHFAVAANIIDYGIGHDFDAEAVLADCLDQEFVVDDTATLVTELKNSANLNVLFLADNCGELVFDGLLVQQLQEFGCKVTLAVRGQPILNDATMEDAKECGLDKICRVISTGSGCPGIPLTACSDEFQTVFAESAIIISKGQGNFETLSAVNRPIYFLLMVKCPVVAHLLADMRKPGPVSGISVGTMVVMKRNG